MTYRYLSVDTVTGRVLGELELSDVTWERGLMVTGGVEATLVASDVVNHPEHAHAQRENTTPYRTGTVVLKDGRVVCDCMWLPRQPGDDGTTVNLSGTRLWSIFQHRYVTEFKDFYQVDQAEIVEWLVNHAVSREGGGLNLTITCPPTGVIRDATFDPADDIRISEAVESLAEGAFDFDLTSRLDGPTTVAREFRLFYPAQGDVNDQHVFRTGGTVESWSVHENEIENVTTVTGGEGPDGEVPYSETFVRQDMLNFGWPRIENRIKAGDLTDRADVVALAEARSVLLGQVKSMPSVELAGYGGWDPGEIVPVELDRNAWYPEGFATYARIATTRVRVSDEGQEAVTVRFADRIAALPPTSESEAVGRALAQYDRRLRNLE